MKPGISSQPGFDHDPNKAPHTPAGGASTDAVLMHGGAGLRGACHSPRQVL